MIEKKQYKRTLLHITILALIGITIYSGALEGQFIWDDWGLVRDNKYIRSWSNLGKIFSEDMGSGGFLQYNFYRPLQIFSYLIDYSVWGVNPAGYHFVNIVWNILVCIALYFLVGRLFNKGIAFLCSILFIMHPVHTQAVYYISGRNELLSAFFILTCLLSYIKYTESKGALNYVAVLLLYPAALLSKENALILPFLALVYHYAFRKKIRWEAYLVLWAQLLLYCIYRLAILKSLMQDTLYGSTFVQRIPGFFAAIAGYIRLLLVPLGLHMDYGNKMFPWADFRVIAGVCITIFLIWYAFRKRDSDETVIFCVGWFYVCLLPNTSIYPVNAFYMAEHWLYLPSIGFFILLAHRIKIFYKIKGFRYVSIFFVSALLVSYSFLTAKQNYYWRDPVKFFETTLKYNPESAMIHNNLGVAYRDKGETETAIGHYKKAISLDRKHSIAYMNLARAYEDANLAAEAEAVYKKSVEVMPDFTQGYLGLAKLYARGHKNLKAREALLMAARLDPENAYFYYYDMGVVYSSAGNLSEAVLFYNEAIKEKPGFSEAYNNLAMLYVATGKKKEAIDLLNKAVATGSSDKFAYYYNLGFIYGSLGDTKNQIGSYEKAVEANPRLLKAYENLAGLYASARDNDGLLKLYRRAIANRLNYYEAYFSTARSYSEEGLDHKAIPLYLKAIKLNPDSAEAYLWLGTSYCAIGKMKPAIQALKKSVEMEPVLGLAHNNLAVAYFYDKNYDLALEHCDKAIEYGYKVDPKLLELLSAHRNKK